MRKASDIEQEDEAHYKAAVLQELRWIRQLADKKHVFESEDERQRRLVVEGAEQPPKVQPAEKLMGEGMPPTPAQIIELDPEQLEWEEFTSRSNKTTWRHPFKGRTLEVTPTWKALKAAILSQPPTPSGRRYYHQGDYFYFLSTEGDIAFKQLRNFKPRGGR